jgi:outer membrane protein
MPAELTRHLPRRRDGCTHWSDVLKPVAAGVALALASMLAQAQNLQDLYDAARGYDAAYLAARSQADAAQSRLAQSGALRLPTANLAASTTRNYSDVPKVTNNFLATANQLALSARQPLYNRANGETISQAEKAYEIATADLEAAEQDLIVRLAQAYFDVLAAQDNLSTTRTNKTAITEQLASAKRNFEVGTATITDTREAQARFDLISAQEIAALNDLSTKQAALDTLVGRSGINPKPLAVPVIIPPLARGNVDEWLGGADADSPTVRKARLAFDIAQIETDKARAGHLPTLDLVGSVGGNHNDGVSNVGTGSGTLPGLYRNASVGLQLNLPVFSGFAVQNRVKETLALAEKARDDLEGARRGVALGIRQAFFGVVSGRALVKALEAAESSSQLALEATQLGYKVGVRVTLDVLNAQTQLFTTQRDLAKSRYDLVMTSFKLHQPRGSSSPTA